MESPQLRVRLAEAEALVVGAMLKVMEALGVMVREYLQAVLLFEVWSPHSCQTLVGSRSPLF